MQAYKKAGVDVNRGYEVVKRIKKHASKTNRLGVLGGIGSFGGLFDLSKISYQEPILVSGTDGVGTKLMLASMLNKHDTIGIDAVAMCVNDVLAQGAQPLYFLDYLAMGKINPDIVEDIIKGVVEGCVQANCTLIGGETAEMPDMYEAGVYDVAGFAVGVVERSKLIDGSKVRIGDILIGLPSSGIHSNGFSLVRHIIETTKLDLNQIYENQTLGQALLTPTKIYVKTVLALIKEIDIHAIAHITGGGFDENIPRVLQDGQGVIIEEASFMRPSIFDFLEEKGGVLHRDMYEIFNMGIGLVLVIDPKDVALVLSKLDELGEKGYAMGLVVKGEGVTIT